MELRPSRQDIVAGVSVAVVLVPQSLAYAQLAGMPAYRGLFAAAIPPLVAAPFASSPYLQPGPTAVSALLTFGALSPLASVGSTRYMELGLLLALSSVSYGCSSDFSAPGSSLTCCRSRCSSGSCQPQPS
ncbi:MAG TPA: SulP family inorganic anion transporter [Gaiellaceae bacterium]|nr:SulP family inorganic anion transporter [Gaiellaceae bacterium]